jgi:adenine-specific DNA-methyltransferase
MARAALKTSASAAAPSWVEHGLAGSLLDSVELLRLRATKALDPNTRSDLGQFLTPLPIARFMASMMRAPGATIRILDAGAGVGSLAAALVADLASRPRRPGQIEVTAYEVDANLASGLAATLRLCEEEAKAHGIRLKGDGLREDFILTASDVVEAGLFAPPKRTYDCTILNPPYRKIHTNSSERKRLEAAGLETTNLYTAFLYLAGHLLAPGGEMVAITPRSFCNGPYFRSFRKQFLKMMRIDRIHVFEARDSAFGDDDVLQENVILHAVRSDDRARTVSITSNAAPGDPDILQRDVPYAEVVDLDDGEAFIHIAPDDLSAAVAERVSSLRSTLPGLGIEVSTGRVVDFRAKNHLRKKPGEGLAPLVYPAHLVNGRVHWPKENYRKFNAIEDCPRTATLMVPAGTYVLVKRFTAKEEPRRLVACPIYEGDAPHPVWGFENHLNYFHKSGSPLPTDLARGLAAFLNTSLIDTYFRQFNGHTQVNATDLRNLPYPTRRELENIGRQVGDRELGQDELDSLVEEDLGMGRRKGFDPVKARKRIDEALSVLEQLEVPREQRNDRSALTLLSLLDLKAGSRWAEAESPLRGITEMMDYFAEHFGKKYAPNTRETVRRFTIHQFVEAGIVVKNPDKPDRPVNSPQAVYQIEAGALGVFRAFGTPQWKGKLAAYLKAVPSLRVRYARERDMERIPVRLASGKEVTLSAGGQNSLIKLIVEEFCPRFTPAGTVIYVGDADDKWACFEQETLAKLGVTVDSHGKMPDVVVHHGKKDWLVLIEAVTSHGPVNPKRRDELKRLFKGSKAGLVFVTAFESRQAMMRYLNELSWETEVWVAESPTHLIHFDGERFLGPYES